MARPIKEKSGTGIYHVMLRGINRQDIFENDEDYRQMTSILRGLTDRKEYVSDSCIAAILGKLAHQRREEKRLLQGSWGRFY